MNTLKEIYFEVMTEFCSDPKLISICFDEVCELYNSENRHYHNLEHLTTLFNEIEQVKPQIKDERLLSLAIFYHDIIYDVSQHDNEEKSADFGEFHLKKLKVPKPLIDNVKLAILATKNHSISENEDINLFTDADLSILGKNTEEYKRYCQKIRYEYLIYPSFLFDMGRISVLNDLSKNNHFYNSNYFREKYEDSAKQNVETELKSLKKRNYKSSLENGEYIQYLEWDGDFSEFFYNSAKILDTIDGVEKINYYPGWFDNGYYRMKYKGVKLHLEYEGMLGTYLKTECDSSLNEREVADKLFKKLLDVRMTNKDLNHIKEYLNQQLTKPILH